SRFFRYRPRVEVLEDRTLPSFGPNDYPAGPNPRGIDVLDANRDGIPDLLGANHTNYGTVTVLLGQGGGTFRVAARLAVGSLPVSVAAGDFNGDGIPDLVAANFGSNTVSVLLGDGNGNFKPKVDYPVGVGPLGVVLADLKGDGIPDLIVANANANTISVLL